MSFTAHRAAFVIARQAQKSMRPGNPREDRLDVLDLFRPELSNPPQQISRGRLPPNAYPDALPRRAGLADDRGKDPDMISPCVISLTVNGEQVEALVPPRLNLADLLR